MTTSPVWTSFIRVRIRSSRLATEILTANVVTVLDEIPASSDNGIRGAAGEAVLNELHKNYPALTVTLKKDVVYSKKVWQENAYISYTPPPSIPG